MKNADNGDKCNKNFCNKTLANIKRTRFEHLQETKLSKKGKKNRIKTVRCRKTRAYRLTKSTPSAKCWFYRLSKPQKGKLSLSNKHGKLSILFTLTNLKLADNGYFALLRRNFDLTADFKPLHKSATSPDTEDRQARFPPSCKTSLSVWQSPCV